MFSISIYNGHVRYKLFWSEFFYRNLRCHWPLLCYLLQEFFWYWSTWGVNDKKIFFQKLETKCSKFDHWKVRKKSILVMCLISENNQGKVLFCGRENGILLTRHTVGRKTNSTHSFSWWRWIVGFFGSGSEAKKDFFSGRASRKQPAPEKMFQKGQPHHDVLGGLMTPQITVVSKRLCVFGHDQQNHWSWPNQKRYMQWNEKNIRTNL